MEKYIIHEQTNVERMTQFLVGILLTFLVVTIIVTGLSAGFNLCFEIIDMLQVILGIQRQTLLGVAAGLGTLLFILVGIALRVWWQDND